MSSLSRARRCTRHCPETGLSLIELLVSLTIGLVLIAGATQVYVHSRNTYAVNESTARLQETARYALSVLEPDIRMANYWGLTKAVDTIGGSALPGDAQSPLGGGAESTCGTNFAIRLSSSIEGSNDGYPIAPDTCQPFKGAGAGAAMPNADTITIRRASAAVDTVASGPLRICSSRARGELVTTLANSPLCLTPGNFVNDLVVNRYYIDTLSDETPAVPAGKTTGIPSLRRYYLTSAADFMDEEITPGVEDMQVQYGVDLGNNGTAAQYLDAGSALSAAVAAGHPIVAVRIWVLVRADTPEAGFKDNRIYEYGDRAKGNGITGDLTSTADRTKAYQPSLSADTNPAGVMHYRRVLVSRTIQLRNNPNT